MGTTPDGRLSWAPLDRVRTRTDGRHGQPMEQVPHRQSHFVSAPLAPMYLTTLLKPLLLTALIAGMASAPATASAAPSAAEQLFKDADLALGERLITEHACAACHQRRVGGDGSAIYRPGGRIQTPGALRGMVDLCSTELKLSLFPEEVTAIAAVLQRDHYRFGLPSAPPKGSDKKP